MSTLVLNAGKIVSEIKTSFLISGGGLISPITDILKTDLDSEPRKTRGRDIESVDFSVTSTLQCIALDSSIIPLIPFNTINAKIVSEKRQVIINKLDKFRELINTNYFDIPPNSSIFHRSLELT